MNESEYSMITDRIRKLNGKSKAVLFAASGLDCLPVTVPVNVAIELCREDKKCLLIDLDATRDAIAKAFDISDTPSKDNIRPRSHKTELEGLSVWPAHNFARTSQKNIKALSQAACEKFDYVLINAPYLSISPDRTEIAQASQYGIIFTPNATVATQLAAMMKACGCKLIGNIQITGSKKA